MKRLALFGGSFDPVHSGHCFIAERAQAHCGLDEVVFVPCWESPHKRGQRLADGVHRLAMLRLATANWSWARVSSWECDREATSYSWETATHWREQVLPPEDALYWILGADQWKALDQWARVDLLARVVTFIVFPRSGVVPEPVPGRKAVFLPDAMEASSSEIRTRCRLGESIDEWVPAEVARHIRENALYASA